MNKRRNLLTGFTVFGMVFALLFAALFTACDPIEGNIDEIRQKAEGGRYVPPPDTTVYYTVTFNSMGGSTVPRQDVKDGETVIRPEDPTKAGNLNFADWYKDEGCTEKYSFDTPVTVNITLYARWVDVSKHVYRVSFNSNGGSAVDYQNVVDGETATRPDDPVRVGYVFNNWYTDTNFNVFFDFSGSITGITVVYAKWTPITYTVVYNKSHVDVTGTTTSSGHTYDAAKTLTMNAFTLIGYTFAGWSTSPGGAVVYTDGQDVLNMTPVAGATVNLYARWTPGASRIGDTGPGGGLIFYYNPAGFTLYDTNPANNKICYYFEVAPASTEKMPLWSTYKYSDVAGTEEGIGYGRRNTAIIVNFLEGVAEGGMAAQVCDNLVSGGKDDWFLPSKDELQLIYSNLKAAGLGDFGSGNTGYWSSSQYNMGTVWIQVFSNGMHQTDSKDSPGKVRAVRAF